MLIYFDRPTQNKALAKLQNLLTADGVLFTGSAELPLALENSFHAANLPLGFACRKRSPATIRSPGPARSLPQTPVSTGASTKRFPASSAGTPATLSTARQLADEGRFAEAAELCETHIREFGVSAEAFYVLGLVRDAAGADSQAGEFYRKALYLEPGHCDTLRQWASLSERNGRTEHARILRERAGRRSAGKNPEP